MPELRLVGADELDDGAGAGYGHEIGIDPALFVEAERDAEEQEALIRPHHRSGAQELHLDERLRPRGHGRAQKGQSRNEAERTAARDAGCFHVESSLDD